MAERVVLHVGYWKSGSTSLQQTLLNHRGALAGKGVYFPATPLRRHRFVVDAFHTTPGELIWNMRRRRNEADVLEQRRQIGLNFLTNQLRASAAQTLILSCENYVALPIASLRALRDRLLQETDDIRIAVYLRHPIAHARSAIQEWIKQGQTTLKEITAEPFVYPFRAELQNLSDVFGQDNVQVKALEPAVLYRGSIVSDILHLARPEVCFEGMFEEVRANSSLSMEALLIADAFAELYPSLLPDGTSNAARGRVDFLHGIKGGPIMLDPAFEAGIDALAQDDLAVLKETWGVTLSAPPAVAQPLWGVETRHALARTLNQISLHSSAQDR